MPETPPLTPSEDKPAEVEHLLETPDLAAALEHEWFKQFLDHVPVAIAVSELSGVECVVYANIEFERLSGLASVEIVGQAWNKLPGEAATGESAKTLGEAVVEDPDYLGAFTMPQGDGSCVVDAWSNIIEGEDGHPKFRLVALVEAAPREETVLDELHARVREKDTQLRELQHRVKNNLQMITALIRVEARGVRDLSTGEGFDRLAGRVEALGLLYNSLGETGAEDTVDLGIYLSQIATAVIKAHAVEGIHLDLQVDTWPVSIDVAMPTGLVVNELLTNALKHAFEGRDGGTIMLHSLVEGDGCRVVIGDDGNGLPEGLTWPKPGKLSSLIVRSLLQNAHAKLDVESAPDKGTRVTIAFSSSEPALAI